MSYRNHPRPEDKGSAIEVGTHRGEVTLELGVMRNFGSLSTDAWASLSPEEARELADDLNKAARQVERDGGAS
ncbi:hypothetical protein [Pseudaminobacter soli (ex Li et al. 2025)]|uniref:Uncharacterized protein n=1 Tax=Pseudaminobacter soli (ex Li et al. 2025) TaxID=1295366 RepID=A0A2P7SEK1_9HYPH|nr:hypothetical protein [Mesorhizobium soli]PSJ60795.1 hypothetical protein C7I85_12190 [Mesorhizobium soli]